VEVIHNNWYLYCIVAGMHSVCCYGAGFMAESFANCSHSIQHDLQYSVISCLDQPAAATAVLQAWVVLYDRGHSV